MKSEVFNTARNIIERLDEARSNDQGGVSDIERGKAAIAKAMYFVRDGQESAQSIAATLDRSHSYSDKVCSPRLRGGTKADSATISDANVVAAAVVGAKVMKVLTSPSVKSLF